MFKLVCVGTNVYESEIFFFSMIFLFIPVVLNHLLWSIVRAVLRSKSAAGQTKVFGTCVFQLTVFSLFYGMTISTFLQPSNN